MALKETGFVPQKHWNTEVKGHAISNMACCCKGPCRRFKPRVDQNFSVNKDQSPFKEIFLSSHCCFKCSCFSLWVATSHSVNGTGSGMWVTAHCCWHEIKSGCTKTGKGTCTRAFYDRYGKPSCTCQETAACHVLFQPKQDLCCVMTLGKLMIRLRL